MTHQQRVIRRKLAVLRCAEECGNVALAARRPGQSRRRPDALQEAAQEGLGLIRPPLPVAAQSLRERARRLVVQGDAEGGRLDHRQRAHRLRALGGGEQ